MRELNLESTSSVNFFGIIELSRKIGERMEEFLRLFSVAIGIRFAKWNGQETIERPDDEKNSNLAGNILLFFLL